MYKIRDKRAFTISYNEGFRAPSLSELYLQHISSYGLIQQGNPDILPERVKSIEMSYEHPHSDSWIWSISTFYNQYENMIDFVYTLPVRSVNRKEFLDQDWNISSNSSQTSLLVFKVNTII